MSLYILIELLPILFSHLSSLEEESVIVTLIIDDGGSPEVLNSLVDYMNKVLEDEFPMVSLLSASVDRFGKPHIHIYVWGHAWCTLIAVAIVIFAPIIIDAQIARLLTIRRVRLVTN